MVIPRGGFVGKKVNCELLTAMGMIKMSNDISMMAMPYVLRHLNAITDAVTSTIAAMVKNGCELIWPGAKVGLMALAEYLTMSATNMYKNTMLPTKASALAVSNHLFCCVLSICIFVFYCLSLKFVLLLHT